MPFSVCVCVWFCFCEGKPHREKVIFQLGITLSCERRFINLLHRPLRPFKTVEDGFILKILPGCLVMSLTNLTPVRSTWTIKKAPESHQTPVDPLRTQVRGTLLVEAECDTFFLHCTCQLFRDKLKLLWRDQSWWKVYDHVTLQVCVWFRNYGSFIIVLEGLF